MEQVLLFHYRYLRGTVFGLMIFLAGTAFCSYHGYDPDPYDDIPPLVIVDFNYLVTGQINQISHAPLRNDVRIANTCTQLEQTADPVASDEKQTISASPQAPPQIFLPLRR